MSESKDQLGSLLKSTKRPKRSSSEEIKKEIVTGESKEQANSQAEDIVEVSSGIDPAEELKKLARGEKKKKLEKERTKCTHWMSDEEIKMLAKLSKVTGKPKYEILGASIKYMYSIVMEEKDERKTS